MSARPRVVAPEILDELPHDHPDAIASRRDLVRVNAVMGNPRWLLAQARANADAIADGITEIGAGDGRLAMRMAARFPETTVSAIDLAPAPREPLPPNLVWRQIDLFKAKSAHSSGGLLVACLMLHHFEAHQLEILGRDFIPNFQALAIVEPDRRRTAHFLGRLAWPFINRVTRHDMHVSIDAGFARGELACLLGLSTSDWRIMESHTITGARRLFARKIR